jgi:hypothetical protein
VLTHSSSTYIDVSVVCASGPDMVNACRTHTMPLAAAKHRVVDKRRKYKGSMEKIKRSDPLATFVVFAMESHGGICDEALQWLRTICSSQPLPAAAYERVTSRLSTALQRGNALIAHKGLVGNKYSIPVPVSESDTYCRRLQQHANGVQLLQRRAAATYEINSAVPAIDSTQTATSPIFVSVSTSPPMSPCSTAVSSTPTTCNRTQPVYTSVGDNM